MKEELDDAILGTLMLEVRGYSNVGGTDQANLQASHASRWAGKANTLECVAFLSVQK